VCHLDAVWLHWMLVAVVIISNLWVIEIGHLCSVEGRSRYRITASRRLFLGIAKH